MELDGEYEFHLLLLMQRKTFAVAQFKK